MQNDKLLPCPFCGGEMELVNVEHSPLLLGNCVFKCKKGCIESVHSFNTEEEAINACNTRKPMERIIERLKEKEKQRWLVLAERNGYERAIEIVKEEGGIE
jgi:hypothetical protein